MPRARAPKGAGIVYLGLRCIAVGLSVFLLVNCIYESATYGDPDGLANKNYPLSYIAAIVAMIFDVAEIVALANPSRKIPRVHPGCLVCEDIVVMCLVGPSIILLLFSDYSLGSAPADYPRPWREADKRTLIASILVFVYRPLIAIWGCVDCCCRGKRKRPAAVRSLPLPPTIAEVQQRQPDGANTKTAPPPYSAHPEVKGEEPVDNMNLAKVAHSD